MFVRIICTIFQLSVLFNYGSAQTAEFFHIESLGWCPTPVNPAIKVFVTFHNSSSNTQIIDGNLSSTVNIGENQLMLAHIETKVVDSQKRWISLFEVKDDFCRSLKMYVGEFGYELQRAAGVIPGTCPVRRGNYHVNNIQLNFRNLKLQSFPFGKLRITIKIKDKSTGEDLGCFISIISNNPLY